MFFAISEGIAFAGAVGLLAGWALVNYEYEQSLRFEGAVPDERVLVGLQAGNWVAFGLFAVLAGVGIIEAHVSFVPSHRERREREVPPEVLEGLDLSIGPTSIDLRLRF